MGLDGSRLTSSAPWCRSHISSPEPALAAPEEGQGRPTTADRPKASGRKERQPNQPTVPHPEDLADAAERTKDAIAEGRRAGTAGQAAGRLGGKSGERRGTERARSTRSTSARR